MQPIILIRRKEPFDDPAYLFELKLDGFRGIANTVRGRMLSKNGHRLRRFEPLLDALPPGYVFDGEIVALDEDGRPIFSDLLFGRREPVYVAFDVLVVDGEDAGPAVEGTQGPTGEDRAPLRHAKIRADAGRRQGGVPGGVRSRPGGHRRKAAQ